MIYYFYKIVCENLPNYAYVGSTRALAERRYRHKCSCNNENCEQYNRKLYQIIRENGGWDNWRMVCIHQGEFPDKRSAQIKEEELRVQLNGNMNSRRCYITQEERTEYDKEYREKNKDYYTEYKKEYYSENKDQIKESNKQYREQNKDKIKEQKNKKFECECGGRYTHANKSQHEKTKKHQDYISN